MEKYNRLFLLEEPENPFNERIIRMLADDYESDPKDGQDQLNHLSLAAINEFSGTMGLEFLKNAEAMLLNADGTYSPATLLDVLDKVQRVESVEDLASDTREIYLEGKTNREMASRIAALEAPAIEPVEGYARFEVKAPVEVIEVNDADARMLIASEKADGSIGQQFRFGGVLPGNKKEIVAAINGVITSEDNIELVMDASGLYVIALKFTNDKGELVAVPSQSEVTCYAKILDVVKFLKQYKEAIKENSEVVDAIPTRFEDYTTVLAEDKAKADKAKAEAEKANTEAIAEAAASAAALSKEEESFADIATKDDVKAWKSSVTTANKADSEARTKAEKALNEFGLSTDRVSDIASAETESNTIKAEGEKSLKDAIDADKAALESWEKINDAVNQGGPEA